MKFNESDALLSSLKNRHEHLTGQMRTLKMKYGGDTRVKKVEDIDFTVKQQPKSRSKMAIFSIENEDAMV